MTASEVSARAEWFLAPRALVPTSVSSAPAQPACPQRSSARAGRRLPNQRAQPRLDLRPALPMIVTSSVSSCENEPDANLGPHGTRVARLDSAGLSLGGRYRAGHVETVREGSPQDNPGGLRCNIRGAGKGRC